MYWTGPKENIVAAEAVVSAIVVAMPEVKDGVELPQSEWVTRGWATPLETSDAGGWAIPAYPGMAVPDGCAEAASVVWMDE